MARHAQGRAVPRRRGWSSLPWLWLGLALAVVFAGAVLALSALDGSGRRSAIGAEQTSHDFGAVAMSNGEVTAKLPITVRTPAVVTDINSS